MNDEAEPTAEEYLKRAVEQDKAGKFTAAIQDFTAALELRPDWLEAYWGRANARHNSEDYDGELHDVEAILRLEPNNERAQSWRESLLTRTKARTEAFNQLLNSVEAASLNPAMVKLYVFALNSYAQEIPGGEDEVERVLDRIIILNPMTGHMARGAYFQAKNDHLKAVEAYTDAIRLNPELPEAYSERATTYNGFGHFQEALADYTRVLELYVKQGQHPTNIAMVYRMRGIGKHYQGDLEGAIADFTEGIRLQPDNWELFYSRAESYEAKEDYQAAIDDYTRVIEYIGALGHKVLVHYNRGRLREAAGDLQGAIADWEAYLALGGGEKFADRAEVETWITEAKSKLNPDS